MRVTRLAVQIIIFSAMGFFYPPQGFAVGHIVVYAADSSSANEPPPNTTAILNAGASSQSAGTNQWINFSDLTVGIHTVEVVTAESGYLIRQSPTDPDAVNDPDSAYGNPRHIEVNEGGSSYQNFLFDPMITASAVVRDLWTEERLEGATIKFMYKGSSGNTITKSKYPPTATYASNWVSNTEGEFPDDTILYVHDYDMEIARAGYETYVESNIIVNATAGDAIDLGIIYLQPVDANTNQIADAWETSFFGSGSNVAALADADGDGMGNRNEYVAGTDPTDGYSHLWLESIVESNNYYLAWYTEPDRTYTINGTTNLMSDTWVQVAGPWEATNGQIEIVWAETNHHLSWHNNYRVEIVPSWWTGTNHVLVRTNDWPTGGGGTNGWGGGLPPTP